MNGDLGSAKAIRWILKFFELLSGLAVNFDKSNIIGLNMSDGDVEEFATELGCQVGSLPLTYLGLKLGGQTKSIANWSDMVARIKKRMAGWESRKISMGGRITLLNSILGAMPIYRLAFSLMPIGVAKEIRSMQTKFLWGGSEAHKKLAWIKWESLCKSKREGGLGIKDLIWFNRALIGKWIWRFCREDKRLWAKVIVARHGKLRFDNEGIHVEDHRGNRQDWWRSVIRQLGDIDGKWMWGQLRRRIGDGSDTAFWSDNWTGFGALREKYVRLFNLSASSSAKVGELGRWEGNKWVWQFDWRRNLRDLEEAMLTELLNEIKDITVKENEKDEWRWGGGTAEIYKVKKAYVEIERLNDRPGNDRARGVWFHQIWKSFAPLKCQAMAWRLCWDRLPTRDNLAKRRLLPDDGRICCCCNEKVESASHLFLRCSGLLNLWNRMVNWIGVCWAHPSEIGPHFSAFAALLGDGKNRKRLGGLWVCIVWMIWRWRNKVVFEGWEWDVRKMETEIKGRFWSWCLARAEDESTSNFSSWASTPLCNRWNVM